MSSFKLGKFKYGFTETATSGGTLTLTASATQFQVFTGSLDHTLVLPAATGLYRGISITVTNLSSGTVTVQNNGLTNVQVITAGSTAEIFLTDNSTANGVWRSYAAGAASAGGIGSLAPSSAKTVDYTILTGDKGSVIEVDRPLITQGFMGGAGANGAGSRGAGGGGGAGGPGGLGTSSVAGNGGPGLASAISGSSLFYAAGGGGGILSGGTAGTGGSGIGGNGQVQEIGSPTAGATNRGAGGGGLGFSGTGGAGGSGVVILSAVTGTFTATGGTLTTSGGNDIWTFNSSGTFQITSGSGTLTYLVVGGGGGGGSNRGGGGGGGGFLTGTLVRGVGSYTVTVGAGGVGATTVIAATNGGNSVFDTIVAFGGGAGGGADFFQNGGNGGSGGGANGDGIVGGRSLLAPCRVTLPAPSSGFNITIKDATGNANTNNIEIVRSATTVMIDGEANDDIIVNAFDAISYISDGTQWFRISGFSSPNPKALFGGGSTGSDTNIVDYLLFSTQASAASFGNLTFARRNLAACSSQTRGLFGGGLVSSALNIIDYVTFATTGNALDFGDLIQTRFALGSCSNNIRGLFAGGNSNVGADADTVNTIDYITLASNGNATDFGDLVGTREAISGCASTTRGLFGGGYSLAGGGTTNTIHYVTIATAANAASFGTLSVARYATASCSNATRGLWAGGFTGSNSNVIDYVTIATLGNAADFGDLIAAKFSLAGCASQTRGLFGGGTTGSLSNVVEQVSIASLSNAVNFGSLTAARSGLAACSNAHGGL